jgi:RNA-directed DNA polymerase
MEVTRPIPTTRMMVMAACKLVKANRGSAGVDGESLEMFEANLKDNVYKIWNRPTSGSYFPPAVKAVPIPKAGGKVRVLGVPTVADRVAQMVVKQILEPSLEAVFHASSFGHRPRKGAKDALEQVRRNCCKFGWVVDLDIRAFFDGLDHELLFKSL